MGPATITLLRGRLDGGGHFYFSIVTQWRQVVNAVNSWDLATLALPLTLACNLLVFHIVCVCISLRFAARFYLKSIEIRRKAVEYKLKSFEICLLSNGSGVRISSGSPRRSKVRLLRFRLQPKACAENCVHSLAPPFRKNLLRSFMRVGRG